MALLDVATPLRATADEVEAKQTVADERRYCQKKNFEYVFVIWKNVKLSLYSG